MVSVQQTAASIVLTETGVGKPPTKKLGDTPDENIAVWSSLPGFQWAVAGLSSRAGVEVLAVHDQVRAHPCW